MAHTLTPVQGSGCKGHSTINQATQKIIEMELIKLNQRPAIDLFLDTHHCFDLMVEACHNMACHRRGATDNYLCLHAQMHHLMKHHVCHKYGVSKDYNTFNHHPWHGAGQGAADAALHYIILSDTLIDAYHTKIQPWVIHNPTLTLQIIKSQKAFIDNVAMSANGNNATFQAMIQQAQFQLQWWHQLIQAMGGSLNPRNVAAPSTHGNWICLGFYVSPAPSRTYKLPPCQTNHRNVFMSLMLMRAPGILASTSQSMAPQNPWTTFGKKQ